MSSERSSHPAAPDISDAVLAVDKDRPTGRLPMALIAAFAAHALVGLGARQAINAERLLAPATRSARWEAELDLAASAPPPPAVAQPDRAPPDRRPTLATPRRAVVHPDRSSENEAAEAANVVARLPGSSAPVDLTADAFVAGKATAYAGGVTTPTGTSTSSVEGPPAQREPHPTKASPSLDRSTRVSLATESWSCPWPREADAEQIDEQTVILRAVVAANGDPESVTILADPGHGFGLAALACARRTHFAPARDAIGTPIRATSPPIRVRFTR